MRRPARRPWSAVVFALALALLPACTNDINDNGIRFTLTVNNNSATPYELFMSSDQNNQGFLPYGTVAANAATPIGNLITTSIYTARLSPVGAGVNAFVYQHQVISGGPNVSWSVP